MYDNETIGVGITTYNRQYLYRRLLDKVAKNADVDFIVTVKNKDVGYGEDDPQLVCNDKKKTFAEYVPEDLGVGHCKNICIKKLLSLGCQHVFLIEDDIDIKKQDVFKKYIDTAKTYNVHHLNFCMAYDSLTKKYLKPRCKIAAVPDCKISVFSRLCGDFQYFTREVLEQVGLLDANHYVNALEHAEHTYRIASCGMTFPFNAFADIADSDQWLEDIGIQSTVSKDSELRKKRFFEARRHFISVYGRFMNQMPVPSIDDLKTFIAMKLVEKKRSQEASIA